MIELLNTDCMEYMATLPDKAFDLAIVDPPFNLSVASKCWFGTDVSKTGVRRTTTEKFKEWDSKAPDAQYIAELRRVSRNQIVWGANHFIEAINTRSPCWIVWDKENESSSFADCELAWTSFKTSVRIFRFMWNGMIQGDMKNKEARIHPTQKPVALYRWLLKNYAKPGQRILDTHGGSMSIAIACDIEGFDLTLCEIDKDYFEAGKKRLELHQSQPRLFDALEKVAPVQLTLDGE
jgi:site-specific DNA-methyltransferase (adenine-specific)